MQKNHFSYLLGGSAVGAINGLLGGGGGMIAVPLLQKAAGYRAAQAHATAIAVILPACILSGIIYALHGLVPLQTFLPVALGVCVGGACGAKLLQIAPSKWVEIIFTALMFAAGVKTFF